MKREEFFPELPDVQSQEKSLSAYAQLHGDCEIPRAFHFEWRKWVLVGHGKVTNALCGKFQTFKICNRVELHGQSTLER